MKQLARSILLLTVLWTSAALAQQFPTVPDNSFIGRLGTGSGSGPSQAIKFSIASQKILNGLCQTNNAFPVYSTSAVAWVCSTAPSANTVYAGPSTGAAVQPTFRALVGADLPNPAASTLGGIESYAAVTHQWINAISTAGVPSSTQPACADLSNSAASCSTDTTNAANITSGNLSVNRLNGGTSAGATTFWNGASVWSTALTSLTPAGGIVSSNSANCSQSAITTTGTIYKGECVNAQTGTSYTFVDGDRGKLVTGSNAAAQAYTLPQAGGSSTFVSGWYTDVCNISTNLAGIITITPTTSTINGASTLKIQPAGSSLPMCARIVSDGTNYQVAFYNTGDQLPGTTTNDAANVGNVGEYVESVVTSGSALTLTSGTAKTITSITLTAGDWDISGNIQFNTSATTSVTTIESSLSATTNTRDITPGKDNLLFMSATVPTASTPAWAQPVGPWRLSISGTTTYYLVALCVFTSTAPTANGIIRARRVR